MIVLLDSSLSLSLLLGYYNKYCDYNTAQGTEDRGSVSSSSLAARVDQMNGAYENRKRGMVLPFEPQSLTFDDIRYSVDMPQVPSLFFFFLNATGTFTFQFKIPGRISVMTTSCYLYNWKFNLYRILILF